MPPKKYPFYDAPCRSFIAPEDIKLDTAYTLTINPDYQANDKKKRFETFKKNMLSFLRTYLPGTWRMNIEMSDTGRLHLHGVIQFTSWEETYLFYEYMFRTKHTRIHTFKFGTIYDNDEVFEKDQKGNFKVKNDKYPSWDAYCKKQEKYLKKLGYDPVLKSNSPYKHTNIVENMSGVKDVYFNNSNDDTVNI